MKSTQAWGWLIAAVVAAGLNAAYHDGGLAWAHRVADSAQHSSAAVAALASGHADRFVSEIRLVTAQNEADSLDSAWARMQNAFARSDAETVHFDVMCARQQSHWARLEANRARIEARMAARTARFQSASHGHSSFAGIEFARCPWSSSEQ
jgi:hypothetical protein